MEHARPWQHTDSMHSKNIEPKHARGVAACIPTACSHIESNAVPGHVFKSLFVQCVLETGASADSRTDPNRRSQDMLASSRDCSRGVAKEKRSVCMNPLVDEGWEDGECTRLEPGVH
jgi:hypothetical protein